MGNLYYPLDPIVIGNRSQAIRRRFGSIGFLCYTIFMDHAKSPSGKESRLLTHILLVMVINLWVFFIVWSCAAVESAGSDAGSPAHHTQKGFRNLYSDSNRGFGALLKWQWGLGPHEPPYPLPG
jgi:hypothetical protein